MKLTNKKCLTALMKSCAKGDVRYYLNGVHMGPEKMTTTDGRMLMQIGYLDIDTDDFPFDGGITPACEGTDASIVPVAAITSALRNCTKDSLPVLDETIVMAKSGPKQVSLISTDLDVEKVTKAKTIDGTYPDVDAVLALDAGTVVHEIGIAPDILIAIGQAAKAIGASGVKLGVVDKDSAMRFEAHAQGQPELSGIAMPMRL